MLCRFCSILWTDGRTDRQILESSFSYGFFLPEVAPANQLPPTIGLILIFGLARTGHQMPSLTQPSVFFPAWDHPNQTQAWAPCGYIGIIPLNKVNISKRT